MPRVERERAAGGSPSAPIESGPQDARAGALQKEYDKKTGNHRNTIHRALLLCAGNAAAQDWFKTGTGLGVTQGATWRCRNLRCVRLPHRRCKKLFTTCCGRTWNICGVLELVSPSFYPPQMPSQPSEVHFAEWAAAPANTYMLAYGNLSGDAANLAAAGYLSDVHNPQAPIALQKIYRGPATDAGARKLAHQFADDIVGAAQRRLAGNRADADRLCRARAAATRKSGQWITTARTSTS